MQLINIIIIIIINMNKHLRNLSQEGYMRSMQ